MKGMLFCHTQQTLIPSLPNPPSPTPQEHHLPCRRPSFLSLSVISLPLHLSQPSLTRALQSPPKQGANRGVGLGLTQALLEHEASFTVIATSREPSKAEDLQKLAQTYEGRLEIVKMDVGDLESVKVRFLLSSDVLISLKTYQGFVGHAGSWTGRQVSCDR